MAYLKRRNKIWYIIFTIPRVDGTIGRTLLAKLSYQSAEAKLLEAQGYYEASMLSWEKLITLTSYSEYSNFIEEASTGNLRVEKLSVIQQESHKRLAIKFKLILVLVFAMSPYKIWRFMNPNWPLIDKKLNI